MVRKELFVKSDVKRNWERMGGEWCAVRGTRGIHSQPRPIEVHPKGEARCRAE